MKFIICPGCSQEKPHTARGYCHACYQRLVYDVAAYRERNRKQLREGSNEHYANNREYILAKHRERYATNREHKLAMNRDWYRHNTARRRATAKQWEKNNKERMSFLHNRKSLNRRALLDLTVNLLSFEQWNNIKAAYENRCAYCNKNFQRLTQDHVIPISKGGQHISQNVVPACRSCNSKKSNNNAPIPVQLVLT